MSRHLSYDEKAIAVANLVGVMDLPRKSVDLGGQYVALVVPTSSSNTRLVIGTAMAHGGCGAGTHLPLSIEQATRLRDALDWSIERCSETAATSTKDRSDA